MELTGEMGQGELAASSGHRTIIPVMHEPAPRTSVVVCTRNRSSLLERACAAILAVDAPAGGWELVIVDNASDDGSREVAESLQRTAPQRIRLADESRVGLSVARNRGIAEARGELIVFVDDDAFPARGWLVAIVAALAGDRVLGAGGPVEPLIEGELPFWFRGSYLPYLTVWDLGSEPCDLRYNEYPRGANMAFRREAFDRFGGFSPHLGRSGKSLLSCEETELCLRLERGGFRTVYVPLARVGHTTPVDRITPAWMERRFSAQGRSEAVIAWMHGGLHGLGRGLVGHRRRIADARARQEAADDLDLRCHRRALGGYLRGMVTAPFGVPRYRPVDPTVTLSPWP